VLNIHPTGSTLPSSLERTLVIQPDIAGMPDSRYVLIVGNTGVVPMFLAVDSYVVGSPVVVGSPIIEFYLDSSPYPVYVCRTQEGAWSLIRRDMITLGTRRAILERAMLDNKDTEALMKSLDPEAEGFPDSNVLQGGVAGYL